MPGNLVMPGAVHAFNDAASSDGALGCRGRLLCLLVGYGESFLDRRCDAVLFMQARIHGAQVEKDPDYPRVLGGDRDQSHQCTATKVISCSDASSMATSTSSTTAIAVPSAAWMA